MAFSFSWNEESQTLTLTSDGGLPPLLIKNDGGRALIRCEQTGANVGRIKDGSGHFEFEDLRLIPTTNFEADENGFVVHHQS